jgi:7-cyano-7-deazaguanine synthase
MKTVMSLSAGMDSATILGQLMDCDVAENIIAVHFQYGSKHNPHELTALHKLCAFYSIEPIEIGLSHVFAQLESNLLRTGGEIPEGHYEEESMRKTVVPGRNGIFTSILVAIAESRGADQVVLGVHAGDHHIYPDCRPDFVSAMNGAALVATEGKVKVFAPYIHINKADILRKGLLLNVPYELTRTCYKDSPIACGKCGSCQERLWSFKENGVEDPIPYESRELIPKKVR